MGQSSVSSGSGDDLQFTTAEPGAAAPAGGGGLSCSACHESVDSTYYALGDAVLCPACRDIALEPPAGTAAGRFLKAGFLGILAGLLGAAIWFAIRKLAHLEVGLIAILVGLLVGKAVRKGSGGRGGLGYQFLAVAITYGCIAANYMPDIIQGVFAQIAEEKAQLQAPVIADDKPAPAAVPEASAEPQPPGQAAPPEPPAAPAVPAKAPPPGPAKLVAAVFLFLALIFAIALAAPFLMGVQNIMGLIIIGIALWEAWKFNVFQPLVITGPYELGGDAAPAPTPV
jgi:hypothetical protein